MKLNSLKDWQKLIVALLILLFFEIFIFNFNYFKTRNYKEEKLSFTKTKYDKDTDIIEIKNINKHINNVKIILNNKDINDYFEFKPYITDAANHYYLGVNPFYISSSNKRSIYQNFKLSGKSKSLKFKVTNKYIEGNKIDIDSIYINSKVPFMFSFVRMFLIGSLIIIIYMFRPSSKLYKIKLLKYNYLIDVSIVLTIIVLFITLSLTKMNPYYKQPTMMSQYQYQILTILIKNKKVSLDETPPESLKSLKNPYDKNLRIKKLRQSGDKYLWDFSYFNEKYYIYFGVGPVLLFYLPIYLLTGYLFSNIAINIILITLGTISILYILYQICNKWFKETSLGIYLLSFITMFLTIGYTFVGKRPDFYFIPIVTSIMLVLFGLGLFISSTNSDNYKKTKLFIGSLLLAFTSLCRPQFLIASFLIIPLYYDYFIKKFKLEKKKILNLLMIVLPYILIASIAMYYNYIRFNSVFDFGQNYNLTTNDMTHRGFVLSRIPIGLFYYFFVPPHMNFVFPYIQKIDVTTSYLGLTIYENLFGGFFATHLLSILCLFYFKFKKLFKDKVLYNITRLLIILSFIIACFDTQGAGILPRYYLDFSWMLALATIIILLTIYNNLKNNTYKVLFKKVFLILTIISIIWEFLMLFIDNNPKLDFYNPSIYYYFYYLFNI